MAVAPLLVIGKDVFTRSDLARVVCFNFHAAARLSAAVATLDVKDARDLFEHTPPSAVLRPQLGPIALAVLGAAFEARKLGGAQPLEAWVLLHSAPETTADAIVTVSTLKARERKREAGEAQARKQRRGRQGARRDRAQRIRGDRFIARAARTATVQ